MYDVLANIITQSWQVAGQMSPYLLFGFLVAGVLSVCISPAWVERHLGRGGWGSVLKAALFGVPLPLCSCGVIPVSASIRQHGASRAATTAFLLSTPQTGVDSIAVTYVLLGPVFAIFRPIAALLTGLVGGGLVQFFGESKGMDAPRASASGTFTENCTVGKHERSIPSRALRYGFVTLPRDIGLALLVGILIAGAMAALVPQDHLNAYLGGGVLSILLLMAAGVPVYVCATASVPIAAGFLHMGASPGAALAFLIAGPATNAATFTTVWKVLGRRTAVLYLITVAASAVACGLLLNWLVPVMGASLPQLGSHTHAVAASSWLYHAGAIVLLAVLAFSYKATSARKTDQGKIAKDEPDTRAASDEHRLELRVTGMTCSHCAESVRRVIAECPGVQRAEVNLEGGRAMVFGKNFDTGLLQRVVEELGYSGRIVAEGPATEKHPVG